MPSEQQSLAREIALVGVMAGLSNALGFLAIPGPLNIQFGLTAIPILLVAFFLGPKWGAVCGLLGGVTQAVKYGHLLYVLYTAIQGAVAGYFAKKPRLTQSAAPIFAILGGFFLVFWLDVLRTSQFTLDDLGATSFADAPTVFGMEIDIPFPVAGLLGAVVLLGLTLVLIAVFRKQFESPGSTIHLIFAGCFGAVAYIPYDAWVLYSMQGYPWLPTWFVLSKDVVQDFIAAVLCAFILQNPRVKNLLGTSTSVES